MKNKLFLLFLLSNFCMIFASPDQNSPTSTIKRKHVKKMAKCSVIETSRLYLESQGLSPADAQDEKKVELAKKFLTEKIKYLEEQHAQLNCSGQDFSPLLQAYTQAKRDKNIDEIYTTAQDFFGLCKIYCEAAGISKKEFKKMRTKMFKKIKAEMEKITPE